MTGDELVHLRFGRPHAWQLPHPLEVTFDGEVLAHVETGLRTVLADGVPLLMAQVAWVCAHPEWEGQGLVTGLLNNLHAWAREQGALFSGLFADIPRFYERVGYQQAPNLGDYGMVCPLAGLPWPAAAVVDLQGDVW